MTRSRNAVIGGFVAAAVALGGCSFGAKVDATEVSMTTEDPVVLRIGHLDSLVSDPLAVNPLDAASVLLVDALTDGLVSLGEDGTVQPELAESWSSTDGIEWRFELGRRRWADRSPVTAGDVVATIERVQANADASLAAARLSALLADDAVSAEGDDVVLVRAREVNYELPKALASVSYGVLRSGEAESASLGVDFVGQGLSASGPFTLGLVTRGAPFVSVRRVADWDEDRAPTTIEFIQYESQVGLDDALRVGDVDVAEAAAGADAAGDTDAAGSGATGVNVDAAVVYAAVGAQRALADPAVRSGVVAAALGDGSVEVGALIPGLAHGCEACAWGAGDPSVLGGVPIRLVIGPGSTLGAAGEALAIRLESFGAVVDRVVMPRGNMSAALEGTADVTVFVAPGLLASSDALLGSMFTSGGPENLSGYRSPEFDAAHSVARSLSDDTARGAAFEALLAQLAAEAPVVPLQVVGSRWAVNSNVSGVVARAGVLFDVSQVAVSP